MSATYQLGSGLYVSLGMGAGALPASGSPLARVVVRIGWASPWPAVPKPVVVKEEPPAPKEPAPEPVKVEPPPPPPDKDKDSIIDAEDACPDIRGDKSTDPKKNGCPPDRDNDGVFDKDDACPDDPGPKTDDPKTNGCPVKTKFAKVQGSAIIITDKVNFALNSDKIIGKTSFDVLDSVFEVLDKTTSIKKVRIEGHTDNLGKPDYNRDLSRRRAESVKAYLLKKGIDASRLDTDGFGADKPLGDNKTEKGRALNRRVEFVIVSEP